MLAAADSKDKLWGEDVADDIQIGCGNDLIYGGAGNNILRGGEDNDLLFGEEGNDRLIVRMARAARALAREGAKGVG